MFFSRGLQVDIKEQQGQYSDKKHDGCSRLENNTDMRGEKMKENPSEMPPFIEMPPLIIYISSFTD